MKVFARILTAAILLVSSSAYAGASYVDDGSGNVMIDFDERSARGLLTAARFSDDPEESIGCGVRHHLIDGELLSWAFCQASMSPNIQALCYTENSELIDKIAGVNHYSYVIFRWDENEYCTFFGFTTHSFQIPDKNEMK